MSSNRTEASPKTLFGFHPNVVFLGIVSFLTDMSSEMIFTLVPLFLANVLGAAPTLIGFVGGLSDSTDAVFRIISGRLSDKLGKRKLLSVIGYSVSAIAKPFMYAAGSWGSVLAIRFADRTGKGIRNSPRDALLAASIKEGARGKGFGLHRAMDTAGAVIGLGAAAAIIYALEGNALELSLTAYRWLVIGGTVPAVIGVIILIAAVREPPVTVEQDTPAIPGAKHRFVFDRRFKIFLAIMAIFTLGNSSDFFVVLRAQNLGSPVLMVTLMLVLFNLTYALAAVPAGILSDRLGRKRVIAAGWGIYAIIYLGFGAATQTWQVWLLFAGYGIYYGVIEGVARAFIADLVPQEARGTAYGLFYGVVGLVLLPASVLGGWLWQTISPAATFYFGAGLAFLGAVGMLALVREKPISV